MEIVVASMSRPVLAYTFPLIAMHLQYIDKSFQSKKAFVLQCEAPVWSAQLIAVLSRELNSRVKAITGAAAGAKHRRLAER